MLRESLVVSLQIESPVHKSKFVLNLNFVALRRQRVGVDVIDKLQKGLHVAENHLYEIVHVYGRGNQSGDCQLVGLRLDHHCELLSVDLKDLAVENIDLDLHRSSGAFLLLALHQKVVLL